MMRIATLLFPFFATPALAGDAKPIPSPGVTSVAMEMHGCFWGTCPQYVVAINAQGEVSYIGLNAVKTRGPAMLHVPVTAFQRIVAELYAVDFSHLRRMYASKEDGCNEVWSDSAGVTFYVTRGNVTQSVFLYYGCKTAGLTDKLSSLAHLIDAQTGVEALVGRDP